MKFTSLIPILAALAFAGCSPSCSHHPQRPHLKEHVALKAHRYHKTIYPLDNGQYCYQDGNFWFYMWMLNSNSTTPPTVQYVERSTYPPLALGRTFDESKAPLEKVVDGDPEVGDAIVPVGTIEQEDLAADQEVVNENHQIDVENQQAIEAFENEGGNLGAPEPESPSTTDTGTTGGDTGGSSDAGGGGGDGGGGGGD